MNDRKIGLSTMQYDDLEDSEDDSDDPDDIFGTLTVCFIDCNGSHKS